MPFQKGQVANPLGRRVEDRKVRLLARQWTERAVNTLARMLDSEEDRTKVMAAVALLDRAYGKPKQVVDATVRKTIVNVMTADERRRKLVEALGKRAEPVPDTVQ